MMEYSRTFQEALEYSLTLDRLSDQEGGNNLPYKGKRNGTLTSPPLQGLLSSASDHA